MANNRLYVVNTDTKEYTCLAKNYGGEWQPGNKDCFMQILRNTYEAENTDLIFVTENDDDGYKKYIGNKEYKSINETGKWEHNW